MSFTYTSVITRPNTNVQWWANADATNYNATVDFVKQATGYVSGTWAADPNNANQFVVTHSWTNRAAWAAMSKSLQATAFYAARAAYFKANGITEALTLNGA